MHLKRLAPLAAALAVVAPAAAQAADCSLHVDPLVFDDYDPFTGEPTRATSDIQVRCNGLALVDHVEVTPGLSANFQARAMAGPDGTLAYNVYADPAALHIAGDGTAGTVVLTSRRLTRNVAPLQRFRLYGRIPPKQFVPTGDYMDVLQVIVVF